MHLPLLSAFPRVSLTIVGLALSALCAAARPMSVCTAPDQATRPPVRCSPAPEAAGDALVFDCNGNGIEDSVDIALGASSDQNHNGVPDECEAAGRWIGPR